MKSIFLFFGVIAMTFISCDPPKGSDLYRSGTISINATVINPRTTINLGDSVAFYFEVPDTIVLNGEKIKVLATASDGATNSFSPCKIDTLSSGGFVSVPPTNQSQTFAAVGSIDQLGVFKLANQNGRLVGKYYMIPQQRGTYFFWQRQFGYVDLNGNSLRLRFKINFGNINRNHLMLIASTAASNRFDLFLQEQINQELEIYGFKVN